MGRGVVLMFAGVYHGRRVLVTGHTGFKGSWLICLLKRLGAEVLGYSLGPMDGPSHWSLLDLYGTDAFGDLRDVDRLNTMIERFKPEAVFHLAAQSLVRPSYEDPIGTYQTNVMGTMNLLEAVRRAGTAQAVVVVTSDKCYENNEWERGYHEGDAMGGYDPYSSSKGCAEVATASYRRSFFHPAGYGSSHHTLVASARAGNVIGGGDWARDRLLPDAVRAMVGDEPVEVRKPSATRPWQHVLDPLAGYLLLGQRLIEGDPSCATGWNFGPDDAEALTVREVLERFRAGSPNLVVNYAEHQPDLHEANALRLDCTKANTELNWQPVWGSRRAIDQTSQWFAAYLADGTINTNDDIDAFVSDARSAGQRWAEA
ncbi:MAG: CDP-glucose 4,6-dehydratase [Planctomycetota bacterium]